MFLKNYMLVTAAAVCLSLLGLLFSGCSRPGSGVTAVVVAEDATWDDMPPVEPGSDDWPWWQGPTRDNIAAEPQNPPVRWSETENVIWKSPVPGRGHGSPTIWGDRIFLATADDGAEIQSLRCYARADGELLWQKEIHSGGFMHTHSKNSHASATPVCDGQNVYINFMVQDAIWLTAVDLDGNDVWQTKVGPFTSKHGYGASPFLYKSLLIVNGDNEDASFLAAVHRGTGKVAWRIARDRIPSFSTAAVRHVCGRDQLLLGGTDKVSSYDPNTGKLLWYCDGPADVTAATFPASDQLVFATGGYPQKAMLAIRADGSGDVTDSHIEWEIKRKAAYVPSPLLHNGLLYTAIDRGELQCIEAETGQIVWSEQLRGGFSASPVLAGGNIYLPDEKGLVHVFKPGRKYDPVASNDLADGGFASPVICGSRIYLRTLHNLYCLGSPE